MYLRALCAALILTASVLTTGCCCRRCGGCCTPCCSPCCCSPCCCECGYAPPAPPAGPVPVKVGEVSPR